MCVVFALSSPPGNQSEKMISRHVISGVSVPVWYHIMITGMLICCCARPIYLCYE